MNGKGRHLNEINFNHVPPKIQESVCSKKVEGRKLSSLLFSDTNYASLVELFEVVASHPPWQPLE